MVDRVAAGRDFCLAPRYQAARDPFRRYITTLLDGRGVRSTALFVTATGLLLVEYVERVCALSSDVLAPDSANIACRGRDRCGSRRSDSCRTSAVSDFCRACYKR